MHLHALFVQTVAGESAPIEALGSLHVIAIHFPIAMLLVAAMAQTVAFFKPGLDGPIRFCVVIGGLASMPVAVLGWAALQSASIVSETAEQHMWLGFVTALLSISAASLCLWSTSARQRWVAPLYKASIFVSAALVGLTAHLGGELVHGPGVLPW